MIKKRFTIKRGDPIILSLQVNGDITAYKIIFVAKLSTDISAERLIEKKNSVAGGTDIETTYADGVTQIDISLTSDDTNYLTTFRLFYDITQQISDDSLEPETIAEEEIRLTADVQTPFDGWAIPNYTTRFQLVNAQDLPADTLIFCKIINSQKVFTTLTIPELKVLLDNLEEGE